jgi:hypothetical protein
MLFRPTHRQRRNGFVLLLVMVLLILFTIIGIVFVAYSSSEARASRISRESEAPRRSDVEAELAFSFFLGQFISDTDDTNGVYSSMRGHSLLRNMFGLNDSNNPAGSLNTMFNGTGRLHGVAPLCPVNTDEYNLVNYMYFQRMNEPLHDPERMGWRANTTQARGPYVGGFNVPYTYPDLNNFYLGAQRASDGAILTQSFHRPWLFGSLNSSNPNWTNQQGKYLTVRPRPADHTPDFPYPEDEGGDVKNLTGCPGFVDAKGNIYNNDSIWMDLGFPVKIGPDGKKYKPLFAPLVLDLDGRINLNFHGNARGPGGSHVSNQGWGAWEINPRLLSDPTKPALQAEWANLLTGMPTPPSLTGRYGADKQPGALGAVTPFIGAPRFYAQVDFDGSNENAGGAPTGQFLLPGMPGGPTATASFPQYPPGYGNGVAAEGTNHPSAYNFFTPTGGDLGTSSPFGDVSNLEAILRYGETNSPALTSNLFTICPQNMSLPNVRRMVTTASYDIEAPCFSPWTWDPTAQPYQLAQNALYPTGAAAKFPNLTPVPAIPANSEFASDYRSAKIAIGGADKSAPGRLGLNRLDLNQTLPKYPTPNAQNQINPQDMGAFQAAQIARQQLANDIFTRLRAVTGAPDPATVTPGAPGVSTPDYDALRYLAQLSVNIVDYIDGDDIMTPFNWNPAFVNDPDPRKGWVFGTELPRLVLNEAYAEMVNDPAVQLVGGKVPPPNAVNPVNPYRVNVYLELHNPFNKDTSTNPVSEAGNARLQVVDANNNPVFGAYKITVANGPISNLRSADNVLGNPDLLSAGNIIKAEVTQYKADPTFTPKNGVDINVVQPANGATSGPVSDNQGFYLIGPKADIEGSNQNPLKMTLKLLDPPAQQPQANTVNSTLSYTIADPTKPPTNVILLRRLACPNLPEQPDPTKANFNPYVTVDYLESVRTWDAIQADTTNTAGNRPTYVKVAQRSSTGKQQPYASSQVVTQVPPAAVNNQPANTFFSVNAPATTPFDWLTQIDRPLISLPELFHVSGFKPHELTQQFVTAGNAGGAPQKFTHRAPWMDQNARLYRLLELLATPSLYSSQLPGVRNTSFSNRYIKGPWSNGPTTGQSYEIVTAPNGRMAGLTLGGTPWAINVGSRVLVTGATGLQEQVIVTAITDSTFTANFINDPGTSGSVTVLTPCERVPGKININTVWDTQIFQALCDAQTSNYFTANDVQTMFPALLQARSPKGVPDGSDRPFVGMGAGYGAAGDTQYPNGIGIDDTFLRADPNDANANPALKRRLFELPNPASSHPAIKQQLMAKIFNNLTCRSNVFAVWLTVGYFEVVDDSAQPVKLGAEIGRSENRQIRHRMFAIVDRSFYAKSGVYGTTRTTTSNTPVTDNKQAVLTTPQSMLDIHKGSTLTIVQNGFTEKISIISVDPVGGTFQAKFNNVYGPGFTFNFTAMVPTNTLVGYGPAVPPALQGPPIYQLIPTATAMSCTCLDPVTTPGVAVNIHPSDPTILQWLQPGVLVAGSTTTTSPYQSENVTVNDVTPITGPTQFLAQFTHLYNPGFTIYVTVNSINDTPPSNPTPTQFTRFNIHNNPGPLPFFSVID